MTILHRTRLLLGAALLALSAVPATAQLADQIEGDRLQSWRVQTGNHLRLCVYPSSTTIEFDKAVGQAIAERLLLSPRFIDLPEGYGLDGEYAAEDFYVKLVNECDAALTMTIVPNAYPEDFTVTRPIAAFSYILVSDDPAITALTDIPATESLGGGVMTYGDYILGAHIRNLPKERQWRRIPFGTNEQMLGRLLDGTIAAMVIFAPDYQQLLSRHADLADKLHVAPLKVELTSFLNRGAVLLAQNTFLRSEMDAAITDMMSDGTIDRILKDLGMDKYPVRAGGI